MFILVLLLILINPTLPTSDFEASQVAISSTSYKSLACWFGSCSPSESTTTLTAEPLPSSPYIPVPEAPAPAPATQPSYTIKMTQQDDTGSGSAVEASVLNYELQLKNVPAAVVANVPFGLTVIFMETTTNSLVYTDPAGVYGAPFDVTLSLSSAGESMRGAKDEGGALGANGVRSGTRPNITNNYSLDSLRSSLSLFRR